MTKKLIKYSIYILLILLVAYSGAWTYLAYRIKSVITGPAQLATKQYIKAVHAQLDIDKEPDKEPEISYKSIKVRGYPLDIEYIITDYVIESDQSTLIIPKIKIKFDLYNNKISADVDKFVYQPEKSPETAYEFDANAELDLKFNKHFLLVAYQAQDAGQLMEELRYIKYSDNVTASLNLPLKFNNKIKINTTTKEHAKEGDINISSSMNIGNPQNFQSEITVDMKIIEPNNNDTTIEVRKIEAEVNDVTVALSGNIKYQKGQWPYGLITMQIENYKALFNAMQQMMDDAMDEKIQESLLLNAPENYKESLSYALNMLSKGAINLIQNLMLKIAHKVSEQSLSINIARTKSGDITIGNKSLNSIIEEIIISSLVPDGLADGLEFDDEYSSANPDLDSPENIFDKFGLDFVPEYDNQPDDERDYQYYEDNRSGPNQN